MACQMPNLLRTRIIAKAICSPNVKFISTFPFLSQEPLLANDVEQSPDTSSSTTSLPPNPAIGSPIYNENWRSPIPYQSPSASSSATLVPVVGLSQRQQMQSNSSLKLGVTALLNHFVTSVTACQWSSIKDTFETWIRSMDSNGNPNKPTVELYNYYLRANLMMDATVEDLLDLVAKMEDFAISPNTASFNLVLKAMLACKEYEAAEKLLQRMEAPGNLSPPDDESYDLVIRLLFQQKKFDAAFKHVDEALKRNCTLSSKVFTDCIHACLNKHTLEKLVSVIERCKAMDQNKILIPPWNVCIYIADVAIRDENTNLTLHALDYMRKCIRQGYMAKSVIPFSVDERLIVGALRLASKTFNSTLLDSAWDVLRISLRQKKPSPQTYVAKINAYASVGNLERAFGALKEFEASYDGLDLQSPEELLSPFSSLHPLVMACSSKGFESLDLVYYQLESLNRVKDPYRSVTALNCVLLGCASIWDLVRSYQTFEAISSTFGLTPDVHSYNSLMLAYGKQKGITETEKVFNHMQSLGIKPNAKSYSLLVDAHLAVKDAKSAISVVDQLISAGFEPTWEMLKKIRRRCIREMDYESNDMVESYAKRFNITLGTEAQRDLLFKLDYSTSFN